MGSVFAVSKPQPRTSFKRCGAAMFIYNDFLIVIIGIVGSPIRPQLCFVSAARIVNLLMCLMIGVHLVWMIILVRFVCLVVRIILIWPIIQLLLGMRFPRHFFHCFLFSEPKKSTHLHRAWTTISDYTIALHATKQDRRKHIGSNCGVKQWNSRGTTKVNTQPLSWFHNENLKEINSFNDLLMSLKGQIPPNLIRTLMIRIINVGGHITS